MTSTAKHTARCLRPGCGRKLSAPSSVAAGYGPVCRARIRLAALNEAIRGFATRQVEAARELIADGGLIPTSRPGVFLAVSSDGERTYLTHSETCACPSGLRRLTACTCKHSLGVRILMATGKVA